MSSTRRIWGSTLQQWAQPSAHWAQRWGRNGLHPVHIGLKAQRWEHIGLHPAHMGLNVARGLNPTHIRLNAGSALSSTRQRCNSGLNPAHIGLNAGAHWAQGSTLGAHWAPPGASTLGAQKVAGLNAAQWCTLTSTLGRIGHGAQRCTVGSTQHWARCNQWAQPGAHWAQGLNPAHIGRWGRRLGAGGALGSTRRTRRSMPLGSLPEAARTHPVHIGLNARRTGGSTLHSGPRRTLGSQGSALPRTLGSLRGYAPGAHWAQRWEHIGLHPAHMGLNAARGLNPMHMGLNAAKGSTLGAHWAPPGAYGAPRGLNPMHIRLNAGGAEGSGAQHSTVVSTRRTLTSTLGHIGHGAQRCTVGSTQHWAQRCNQRAQPGAHWAQRWKHIGLHPAHMGLNAATAGSTRCALGSTRGRAH